MDQLIRKATSFLSGLPYTQIGRDFYATRQIKDHMTHLRSFSDVLDRLKAVCLRPTRQRLALAKLLFEGADRHVTAELLHAEAQAAKVRVSLATVYNTLHQFTSAGLLREVVVDPGRSYFDTNSSDHHHFFFEDRGTLQDIPGESVSLLGVPNPPVGTNIISVDVVIRVRDLSEPS